MKIGYKLTGVFLIFALSMTAMYYLTGLRNRNADFGITALEHIRAAKASFQSIESRDTNMLFSALEVIVQDPAIKEAYLCKNREMLYEKAQGLFNRLRERNGITHFYFIGTDGAVFLRMHDRAKFGDSLKRYSFLKARDTKAPAWGIELGKTAFALRAVMPYYREGTLIGYVELGEEIDHFLHILKGGTKNEYAIIAEKAYLDRDDWKSVKQAAGRRDNWDDMGRYVLLAGTKMDGPALECFGEKTLERVKKGDDIFRKVHDSDRTFMCGGFVLDDALGRHIGAVLTLDDISDHVAVAKKTDRDMLRMAALFFWVIFAAGVLISRSITRPIRKLAEAAEAIGRGDFNRKVSEVSSDEIGQLAAAFNDMLRKREQVEDALLESDRRVRALNEHIVNMLMVMSHDIRGPFAGIMATTKLLLRGSFGRMDESVANTLKDLLARVSRLQGIAEDCLGKAHAVEGSLKIEREVLDLRSDIIDAVLDELSGDIHDRGIIIDNRMGAIPAGTIPVSANKTWLKAVFRNIFANAIKYGGKGCTIAFGFEDHGSYYRLNVYNSGRPIAEADREKLFTKFGRIGSDAKDAPKGTGLGLYLVREILRKHGGDIWYEARHDGSDFIVTLPKESG